VHITRRMRNYGQRLVGNVKVAMGRLTGNRRVGLQGRSDQVKAGAKQAAENVRGWRRTWVRS
jgi:uncharacterized protein YjbJ (UPF0337 family)